VHAAALVPHLDAVTAVGRGLFIWLIFRSLAHAVGWPVTIAIVAAVALTVTLARRRRL